MSGPLLYIGAHLRHGCTILYYPILKLFYFVTNTENKANEGPFRHVIWKLVGFTIAMITTPVGMYFVSVNFGGEFTFAFHLLLFSYLLITYALPLFNLLWPRVC